MKSPQPHRNRWPHDGAHPRRGKLHRLNRGNLRRRRHAALHRSPTRGRRAQERARNRFEATVRLSHCGSVSFFSASPLLRASSMAGSAGGSTGVPAPLGSGGMTSDRNSPRKRTNFICGPRATPSAPARYGSSTCRPIRSRQQMLCPAVDDACPGASRKTSDRPSYHA